MNNGSNNRIISRLSDQQRRIIEILWKTGGATVQEVLDRVNAIRAQSENESEPLAYTTILTFLQKLEQSGWVRHEKKPGVRAYVYSVVMGKGEAVRDTFSAIAKKLFAGNRTLLFQHLLADEHLTAKDLDEIGEMIKRRASEENR